VNSFEDHRRQRSCFPLYRIGLLARTSLAVGVSSMKDPGLSAAIRSMPRSQLDVADLLNHQVASKPAGGFNDDRPHAPTVAFCNTPPSARL
jgi:hypothetical protein